MPCELN